MILDNNLNWQKNSAFPSSDWTNLAKYIVDDNSDLAQKIMANPLFEPIEDENGNLIDIEPIEILPDIDEVKKEKLREVSIACNATITNGIDIGEEHFSLTQNDQINLSVVFEMVKQGAETALYHADYELCRPFTADEIITLMTKATEFKTYHTTYCNHINMWIRRAETIEDVQSIHYGDELPADLQSHLMEVLGLAEN